MVANRDYDTQLAPDLFFNPRGRGPNTPPRDFIEHFPDGVDTDSDFVWTGKGKKIADQHAIIAYEKPETLGGDKTCVLRANGEAEFMPLEQARKLIPSLAAKGK